MTEKIQVIATIYAKDGSELRIGEILNGLVAPTRAETGCLKYNLYNNSDNPSEYIFIEEWVSRAALDDHLQTPHFIEAAKQQQGLLAEPTKIVVLAPL